MNESSEPLDEDKEKEAFPGLPLDTNPDDIKKITKNVNLFED